MRYGAWIKAPELGPPQEVAESDAIDLALENGQWKGAGGVHLRFPVLGPCLRSSPAVSARARLRIG